MNFTKSKMGPRKELILSAAILIAAIFAWYITLYQPLQARTSQLDGEIQSELDSLAAIKQYDKLEASLKAGLEKLNEQVEVWDRRFPPRDSIVAIAKHLISFAGDNGLQLVDLEPSLFELYALERAGAQVSGRYVMHLPLTFKLQGRYLDLGRMLEQVDQLPFNLTVADVTVAVVPDRPPLCDISLAVYLYVHL